MIKSRLVFATNNKHKINEIKLAVGDTIDIVTLSELNCFSDIPESNPTLEGNAIQKARFIYDNFKMNCFADDTGLEVEALDGRPGVYSARYSEDEFPSLVEEERSKANINKILSELLNTKNRKARFRTVIALIIKGEEILFDGTIHGTIIDNPTGSNGFGYDPVFIPNGYQNTFAELNIAIKNTISHRAIAIKKLVKYLNSKDII